MLERAAARLLRRRALLFEADGRVEDAIAAWTRINRFRPEADIFVRSAQPWDHMNPALPKYGAYPPGKSY